ncbi:MAG: type II toxin-antitoxin system RelE/ParE family toxin [Bryobacteraceae bacterium]
MSRYRLTPKAEADLFAIWSYIAADNTKAADRVETVIYEACVSLAQSPLPPCTEGFKEFAGPLLDSATNPNYVIVYDPEVKPLNIIRILHGARDISQQPQAP